MPVKTKIKAGVYVGLTLSGGLQEKPAPPTSKS
jgi:hypothetical protein